MDNDDLGNTKKLLSKFGINDQGFTDLDIESVHAGVGAAQEQFGLVRLKIGALLIAVREKELWRGRASSFNEYLDSERIKPTAARQYMTVAEKLLFELKLSETEIKALSKCSMTTLTKACARMTRENQAEIISLMEMLSDKDAKHVLDDYEAYKKPLTEARTTAPQVKKMVSGFYDLPSDLRMEFLKSIGITRFETSKPATAALSPQQQHLH